MTISCLINLISDLPPEQRTIPLSAIAERTKLDIGAQRGCGSGSYSCSAQTAKGRDVSHTKCGTHTHTHTHAHP